MKGKFKLFFVLFLISCSEAPKENVEIPNSLAGIKISQKIEGKKAIRIINDLHSTSIPVKRGIIAFYGKGEITLYLFEVENSVKAESLLMKMKKKMEKSKGPFLPPEKVTHEKFNISPLYVTYGLGQGHFFFRIKNTLFWLSSETHLAYNAMKDLEKFIFKQKDLKI